MKPTPCPPFLAPLGALALLFAACSLSACSGGGASGAGGAAFDPGDRDGDGLSNQEELAGWEIPIDRTGNGLAAAPTVRVFSDPDRADTDGDGLDDREEFLNNTDPEAVDTDGDGLDDREELQRWKTVANSVDSDGDSRGSLTSLFDGNELAVHGTSPTLADTDGDGRDDDTEVDDPFRDALVAELPRLELDVAGEIDVLLNVEYEEASMQSREYGTSFAKSETSSTSSSKSTTFGAYAEVTVGVEATAEAGIPPSSSVTVSSSATAGVTFESGVTTSQESSVSAEEQYSQYLTDSRTATEAVASGSITTGLIARNAGLDTFTLEDLGISVLQWRAETSTFRTLATLKPPVQKVTLGPGDTVEYLQVEAEGVNADVVKGFLARPNSVVLQPANYSLTNVDGKNFQFLNQDTFTRTALVEIDFGGGETETYRVATNVERGSDGSFEGVRMARVMEILGFPAQDPAQGYELEDELVGGEPTGRQVLATVRGRKYQTTDDPSRPRAFWTLIGSRPAHASASFDDVVLKAQDQIRLVYTRDEDGDGVYEVEEQFYGTSDGQEDSDGDGLDDRVETKEGWLVEVNGESRKVFSDPRAEDSDLDGLDDAAERELGTDPLHFDTDGDGLRDGDDPFPHVPAGRLFVRSDVPSGDGASWDTAFGSLQAALEEVDRRNDPEDGDPSDDVSEIWVAQGVYVPGDDVASSFALRGQVAIYGGFAGGETKAAQRNPDPQTNGTILSGDVLDNDAAGGFGSKNDNSRHVLTAPAGAGSSAVLDGFVVTGGYAGDAFDARGGGLLVDGGSPTVRNCYFSGNEALAGGGGLHQTEQPGSSVRLESCVFDGNHATAYEGARGGGAWLRSGSVEDCVFLNNRARSGGGLAVENDGSQSVEVRRSVFRKNDASQDPGGGGLLVEGNVLLVDSELEENFGAQGGAIALEGEGFLTDLPKLSMTNCVVLDNRSHRFGGGVYAAYGTLRMTNCVVTANEALHHFLVPVYEPVVDVFTRYPGGVWAFGDNVTIQNSIVYRNRRNQQIAASGELQNDLEDELSDLVTYGIVRHNCVPTLPAEYDANITDDPAFVAFDLADPGAADLRLSETSPCIDAGTNVVDVDALAEGMQPLPETDLGGLDRTVNSTGGLGATVDMGAHEFQGSL